MTAAVWQSHSTASGTGTQTTANVLIDGAIVDGDLIILTVTTSTNSGTGAVAHTTPSAEGFALITSAVRGGQRISAYWKIAASEPASYDPVWASQTGGYILTVERFTGAHGSAPTSASSTNNGNGSTATMATLTTTQYDSLLVAVYTHTPNSGTNRFSQPAGMSEKFEIIGTGSNGPSIALDTETIVSTGATGTRASTLGFVDNWTAIGFEIIPAVPGSPPTPLSPPPYRQPTRVWTRPTRW